MKPIIQKLWMVIVALSLSISASAYDFEVDGIRYSVISPKDLTVETTNSQASIAADCESLVIPEEVTYNNRRLKVIRIGDNSFENCPSIKKVIVGKNVEIIGQNAFADNNSLESIKGHSVVEIGSSAFQKCARLSQIEFGDHLSIINDKAFFQCSALRRFQSSRCLQKIGAYGFSESGIEEFVIESPTEIEEYAFAGCKNLRSVDFNGSLIVFNTGIFKDCESLSELNNFVVPSKLPSYAFSHCAALNINEILASNNLKSISNYAFEFCKFDDTLEITSSVNKIGSHVFSGFVGNVIISESYRPLEIEELSFTNMDIMELSIGRNLSTWCCSFPQTLTKLAIGKAVSIISNNNLEKAWQLQYFPFQNCKCLKEVYIENSSIPLTLDGGGRETYSESDAADYSDCYYYYYYSGLFSDCPIEKLYIGRPLVVNSEYRKSRKRSKWYSDYYYYHFDSPFSGISTIKEVGGDYNALKFIPISSSVESLTIGRNVSMIPKFSECNLREINVLTSNPPTAEGFSSKTYIDGHLLVPAGSMESYKHATVWENFWNIESNSDIVVCENLLYEVMQNSELKLLACNDDSIEELYIPSEIEINGENLSVISIADFALSECPHLKLVSLPGSINTLGTNVFNENLKTLILEYSDQLLYIPHGTFATEEKDLVTTVDDHSVYYDLTIYNGYFRNFQLEELFLYRNLSSQDPYSINKGGRFEDIANAEYYDITLYEAPFSKLPNLKKLIIGQNVTSIGSNERDINEAAVRLTIGAFEKCDCLELIESMSSVPPMGGLFSDKVYSTGTIVLPNGEKIKYKEDNNWGRFSHFIEGKFVPIISLSLPEIVYLGLNDSKTLEPIINPENASIQELTWISSAPSVVSVSEDGIITSGYKEGTATITAVTRDGSGVSASTNILVLKGAGISEGSADTPHKVTVKNGTIYISGKSESEVVEIFTPQGHRIASSSNNIFNVNAKGVYLVKVGSTCAKVIL